MRIIPSLSPSGLYWRCSFFDKATRKQFNTIDWIFEFEGGRNYKEINLTLKTMADIFVKENSDFIELCIGKDEIYRKWYSEKLAQLEKDELPYAFADYFSPYGFLENIERKRDRDIEGEEKYYFK